MKKILRFSGDGIAGPAGQGIEDEEILELVPPLRRKGRHCLRHRQHILRLLLGEWGRFLEHRVRGLPGHLARRLLGAGGLCDLEEPWESPLSIGRDHRRLHCIRRQIFHRSYVFYPILKGGTRSHLMTPLVHMIISPCTRVDLPYRSIVSSSLFCYV